MRSLEKTIEENLARGPDEVRGKLEEISTYQYVDIPPGERAIYAVSRDADWYLPHVEEALRYARARGTEALAPDDKPISLVMRQDRLWADQRDVGVNLFSQVLVVHSAVTDFLQRDAKEHMTYCPEESTWVQKHLGAATAIGRYDVAIHPDGRLGKAEIDLEASLWGSAHEYNQVVETHILGLFDRIEKKGYKVVSTELPEVVPLRSGQGPALMETSSPSGRTMYFNPFLEEGEKDIHAYHYQHNDAGNRGAHLPFVPVNELTEEHIVLPRGRRSGTFYHSEKGMISFDQYMGLVEAHSLMPGRLRDSKVPLAAMGMGVLATKEDAFQAVEAMIEKDPEARYAIKGARAARTSEMVVVRRTPGRRTPGEFTMSQARRRMANYRNEYGDLVVVQPAFDHPIAEELGLEFRDSDAHDLASYDHVSPSDVRRFTREGKGLKDSIICRIFVLYDQTHSNDPIVIGGLAAGLPGTIAHNDKRAGVWPVFCEGVEAYPDVAPYYSLREEKPGQPGYGFDAFQRRLGKYATNVLHPDAKV